MNKPCALVTGASSGIGEAIAKELVGRGWEVIGVARSKSKLDELHKQLKEGFISLVCDVSDPEAIKQSTRELQDRGYCPTLFFLNAGYTGEGACEALQRVDLGKHREIMAINYFGALAWVESWQEACQKNGGANFIVTSSVNALFAPPIASGYSASKAAIAKAFEALSLSYFGTNLKFSIVYCGPVATKGLKVKLPFTWSAEKMAKYMVDAAMKGKSSAWPSWFYTTIAQILHALPYSWSMRILRSIS